MCMTIVEVWKFAFFVVFLRQSLADIITNNDRQIYDAHNEFPLHWTKIVQRISKHEEDAYINLEALQRFRIIELPESYYSGKWE